MVGSVLTATIIEARDLRAPRLAGSPNPYVVMQAEGQRQASEKINGESNPVWNEIITFDIMTGKEPLLVQVFDRADIGKDQMIGECEIPLDVLVDQYKHDEWLELENEKRQLTGKIRLTLHWIHSRKKFLQDILKIQDMAIEEETQEKQQLEIQLQNMKQPFGFIQAYYV